MNGQRRYRVLITGANGFIGKRLMEHYRRQQIAVAGVDITGDGAEVFAHDIADPESFAGLLAASEVLIHTAALVSNAVKDSEMWRVNVLGTRDLVAAAARHGMKRFVQISSVVAYGNVACGELDETYPVHASGGSYVRTKLASEHVVLAAQARGDIEVVVLRPGDVYGPGSRPWVLLPLQMIRSGQFVLPARGDACFRPVYIDDLVRGIALAASTPQAAGQIINLSCQGYVSTREFFSFHHRWLGRGTPKCAPTWVLLPLAALVQVLLGLCGRSSELSPATIGQLNTRCWYSIARAERLLGWQPEVALEEGMRRTEQWARECGLLSNAG